MTLALLKLQNGTEILGDVVTYDDHKIEVRDPLQINYKFLSFQPMPAISVSRYMPFSSDDVFPFSLDDVVHVVTPKPAVVEYYQYALKNYQENIDPMIDMELSSVVDKPIRAKSPSEDMYKKILESAENDGGPLN